MRISDWSSDVCSSDLVQGQGVGDIDGNPILPLGLDRQERILLKTSEQLSEEFGAIVARIGEMDRSDLFAKVCRILASDTSFLDLGADPAAAVAADPIGWFRSWSTGHKIVMHAVASLVAYTERSEEHTSELQSLMRI